MKFKTLAALIAAFSMSSAAYIPAVNAQTGSGAVQTTVVQQVEDNRIVGLEAAPQGDKQFVRIRMAQPLSAVPPSFSVAQPARIAFDFANTSNHLGRNQQAINLGNLETANIVQVGDRTRVVLNVRRLMAYETKLEGNDLLVVLGGETATVPMVPSPQIVPNSVVSKAPAGMVQGKAVEDVNFRRGKNGEGKVIVQLSSPDTTVDVRRDGRGLSVVFPNTLLPETLRRTFDVADFATPVNSFRVDQLGRNTQIRVQPTGLWEYNAYQSDNQFVLEVKRVKEDPSKLVQGLGNRQFGGEKLSLNFQDVEVRAVLQVIADFTGFNIVTSDSVQGNLTLRLQDVPWDQALDIILQAKGLDMRKNGNVIWIAPAEELAQREKVQLETMRAKNDLEPVRTQIFQVNYHKAKEIAAFLSKQTGGGDGIAASRTALSNRGSVTFDDATNKLFVTDIGSKLEEIALLLQQIDLPPQQVLIEARIVEATKGFSRDLGVRLGVGASGGTIIGYRDGAPIRRASIGSSLDSTMSTAGQTSAIPVTPNVDLPASTSGAPGLLSMVLWNTAATRFLSLELSALESDGRGRILSSPKVLTANQKEALIAQGEEVPYLNTTSTDGATVEFKKAELELKVKPQITPDGRVAMTVEIKKDKVAWNRMIAGTDNPPIDTRRLTSDVLVENGGTVVLGGIFEEEESNKVDKVPLLGDIPVVGNLFKNRHTDTSQKELLIFITPRIVTDELTLR
ncbi:MAG: type IV pilus secretin PilQ family protein [Rhodocyclaceae bacterium]|nr:type IV pilus secretin PilQ family protein [Rhodocyclaceae bacterium]MBR4737035.1 type IV pilus secretin PilQ family protein [Rhodocyclaceae bacterium]